jgi:histidinol-phosphate/aromatic aminotransferase/cobyric acid decarboxylase-like protein
VTRRDFAALCAAGVPNGDDRPIVALDNNENPEGPPEVAIAAMREALPRGGRYQPALMSEFLASLAQTHDIQPDQLTFGAGSFEVLQGAVLAFTGDNRPLIQPSLTFSVPSTIASALGRPVVRVPMSADFGIDVERLAAEARKVGGGVVYLVNPNNPTSAVTPASQVDWLVANLPPACVLLLDEAYIHFWRDAPDSMPYVRNGARVIVARTFSKIFGMAGLRVGYGCGPAGLIARMVPFRNFVISPASVKGALAAWRDAGRILPGRIDRAIRERTLLCDWLRGRGIEFVEPHASMIMINVRSPARPVIDALAEKNVLVGRSPAPEWLRVSIGSPEEMQRFRSALAEVLM